MASGDFTIKPLVLVVLLLILLTAFYINLCRV
jgi:hypothetical protein